MRREFKLWRGRLFVAFCLSLACIAVLGSAASSDTVAAHRQGKLASRASGTRPSEKFNLARSISRYRYAVIHEASAVASIWAAYVLREEGKDSRGRPCAYVGAISRAGPEFFHSSANCGRPWPAPGVEEPVLAGVRGIDTYKGRRQGESFGILLVSNAVRSLRLVFSDGSYLRRQTHKIPESATREARVPNMRYAAYSISRDRCIGEITAWGASGPAIGHAVLERCAPTH